MPGVAARSRVLLIIAVIATVMSGCRSHRQKPAVSCPPYLSDRSGLELSEKPNAAGVASDYDLIDSFESVRSASFEQLAHRSATTISLNETVCAAARNSELADLIEAERHALKCRTGVCGAPVIDLLLQGEALEQRNTAAGAAGRLFLSLVEVKLQSQLLSESKQHLDELAMTIQGAAEEGFATADLENELAAGLERFNSAESKLHASARLLNCQLNSLINIDSENLVELDPVYDLAPQNLNFDSQQEIAAALLNRPGVVALESALTRGIQPDAMLNLLKQMDPRLGTAANKPSIKQRVILSRLLKTGKHESAIEPDSRSRHDQLVRVLEGKKSQTRTEARVALVKIQSAMESVAIANERVEWLSQRAKQLSEKEAIDAQNAFRESNQNWIDLQNAKSQRISAAVEHDVAVLELLQAQGQLIQDCGYGLAIIE